MTKRQWEILLDYLLTHDGITGRICMDELGIINYKGRVYDIRKHGYTVKTTFIDVPNRQGGLSKVAWYSIPEPETA